MKKETTENFNDLNFYFIWFIALMAMIISLIMSEVFKFLPCTLCWYQRIFMYPMVFIIPVGILNKDSMLRKYIQILTTVGLMISFYHVLIYYNFISEGLSLCNAQLSCKTKQFELFGFLSIPLMSFLSYLSIFVINQNCLSSLLLSKNNK